MSLKKKTVSKVIAAILVLALVTAAGYAETLDEIKNKKSVVGKNLEEVMEDLEAQQKEISKIEKEIDEKEAERQELQKKLDKVKAETEVIQKNYEKTKKDVGSRVRSMYKSGSIGIIDVIMDSASPGEFVDNVFFMQKIFKSDQKAIEQLEADKRALERKQKEISEIKEQVEASKESLKQQKASEVVKKEKLKKEVAAVQAEFDRIAREQRAMEAELARIEAEAQQKAEEEAQGGGTSGGGSGSTAKPGSGGMVWPTTSRYITSPFGYRIHPTLGISRLHTGVDLGAPTGAPIYAAKAGVVAYAGRMGSYGNLIIVSHGGNLSTRYAHCNSISVRKGQSVAQGQVIGAVGSTGRSTGPHLHFEVRVGGTPVQPLGYI